MAAYHAEGTEKAVELATAAPQATPQATPQARKAPVANLASEAGLQGYAGITVYCTSKGAVVNLTRAMAMELAPAVRVNCLYPGVIDTDMARIGFAAEGEATADRRGSGVDPLLMQI